MVNTSIVFGPELDERQLDRETSKVDNKLQSVGEDVPVSFDPDEMGGMEPPGVGGGEGGGMPGGAGAAAGMASKIPKPVAGVAASAALPVALAGGVGVGLLSAMGDASARLQTSANILGTAKKNFFREPGNVLDENIVRPLSKDILGLSTDFEDTASSDGITVALGELLAGATVKLGEGAFSWLSDEIPKIEPIDLLGPMGTLGPDIMSGVVTGIVNEIEGTDFSDFSELNNELTDEVVDAWPGWPSINAEWPGWPNVAALFPGWPSIRTMWPGWPSINAEWPGWPDVSALFPGWPSIRTMWPGWPSINAEWSGWPSIRAEWSGWPSIRAEWPGWVDPTNKWNNMGGWPDLGDLWRGWGTYLPDINADSFIDALISGDPDPGPSDPDPGPSDPDPGPSDPDPSPSDPDDPTPGPPPGRSPGNPSGPELASGGRVASTGTATVHRGELVTDEGRLVRELADAIDTGGGGTAEVDLSPLESKLDRLHNDLRQLRRAMDVTLEIDKETLGRATSDAKTNRMADTDPTV